MSKITVGSAVDLINSSIEKFHDGLNPNYIELMITAVNNHLQVRDYLMGMPATHPINECVEFVSYLSKSIDEQDRYAVDTVNAMFQYELGNVEKSKELLTSAKSVNPDYNLAQLLTRVISAQWPYASMATMRSELHPKVVSHLEDIAHEVIG